MLRLSLTTIAAVLTLFAFASSAKAADWIWPVQGEVITPYRNIDDPYAGGQHRGIDIAGPVGTPVVAATGGEVRFAGIAGTSGLTVSVRTADGRFDTSYLHLSSIAVREGEHVPTGGRLGAVGTTGRRSAERPHLHFGVRDAGTRHDYRDPLTLLPAPPVAGPQPSPRALPAPQPVPPAGAPQPAPLPGVAPSPRRVPGSAPRRLPHASPRPLPDASPRRVPAGSPHRVPGGLPQRIPAGSPHRVPGGLPQRIPASSPQRVPAGAPARLPAGSPHHAPAGAPGRIPAGAPRHAPSGLPGQTGSRGLAPHDSGSPHGHPEASASAGNGSAREARAAGAPVNADGGPSAAHGAGPNHASVPGSQGPGVGWVLACLGLLIAAGVIGWGAKGDNTPDRARNPAGRLFARIRPLVGRG